MKTLTMGAAVILCFVVSGCAATGANGLARKHFSDDDIDLVKVIGVNQWAERRHATVMWVNYPKKPPELKNTNG